jgi:methylated-DNA-[protein]-cysteine S-methyltransferase
MDQNLDRSPVHTVLPSTLGPLTIVRAGPALIGLYFAHHWYRPAVATFGPRVDDGFADAHEQIGEYLTGARREFELPLAPRGDEFQQQVWALVRQISYGETATYGDLAGRIGGGTTAQQLGAAVGRNPLSVLIPCHRVVGRGGKLTGYAGGLARKRHLLELESDQFALLTSDLRPAST